jgi:hypothetical protein
MDPIELFFSKKIGPDKKPLFRSQTDLVKAITSHPNSEWAKKNFNSVRAFVNQVMNGERRLSENLRTTIFDVLESKFGKTEEIVELEEEIDTTFEDFFVQKKQLKKRKLRQGATAQTSVTSQPVDANDYYLLRKRGLVADTVHVTTRIPEILLNTQLANELKQQMLTKLSVLKNPFNYSAAQYRFYFPHANSFDDIAFRFWKDLYMYLRYEQNNEQAEELLQQLNTGSEAKLRVFSGPSVMCSYPIMVYDLGLRAEVGFTVFDYEDKGVEKISTARLAPSFLKWWKAEVHSVLSQSEGSNHLRELKFTQALKDIRKNESL